ncbi:hypothetical protein NHB29_22255 (plasmid) [Pantoea agglomerans]|uniref:hypothetical protein n=2 Tax=Enterobacter agglomerans TaxID=549 RepID=UPI00273A6276|nr:hypothetical protein [Pantoea agglomerans]WLO87225.1 hypothetical protein NHB29_22255 [Pantoea agglomerans]
MMKRELTLAGLMASLSGFAPDTPCVAHIWMADDFEDIDPELTPGEVTAAIELADRTLDADISLSWGFMRDCAESVKARRETE